MTRSMLVIGMALALVSPALAQDGPAQFQQMVHFTVKPGMEDQFEAIVKQYVEAADKTGAPNRWNVFHQGPGGSPNHYHLVTSFNEFSERDAWTGPGEMFIEAHGEEEFAAANRRWAAAVTNVHITLSTHQPDLSTKKTAGGIQNHYLATNTEIRPDKLQEYRWRSGKSAKLRTRRRGPPRWSGGESQRATAGCSGPSRGSTTARTATAGLRSASSCPSTRTKSAIRSWTRFAAPSSAAGGTK